MIKQASWLVESIIYCALVTDEPYIKEIQFITNIVER